MAQKYRVDPRVGRQATVTLGAGSRDWVQLGRLAELGPSRAVRLGLDHEHVLAVVGKRGSGKSFTMGSIIEGLCTADKETALNSITKSRATLLFDTLNIFQFMTAPVTGTTGTSEHLLHQERLLREWKLEPVALDVDLWVPAGFTAGVARNTRPFRIRTWDMEAADWAALLSVDAVQDILGQLITTVLDKVNRRGWARDDGTVVGPRDEYVIDDLLDCLADDHEIAADYAPQSVRALRQRLGAYAATPLFGPDGTPLNELLQPGRLSILLLSGVPDDIRLVCIYLTLRKLLQARSQASEAAKALELGFVGDGDDHDRAEAILAGAPPKTWVVIDEAQNVFPSERQTAASETLLRFVREGRNFGLSLAFTTQQPTALDTRVMAQVDTAVVHTLTAQSDLAAVLKNLKAQEPDSVALQSRALSLPDAIRSLAVGQAFVSSVDSPRCVFIDVRPRVSVHGGFEG